MNYILDTHTHTIVSGHAFNTIDEMVQEAKNKGLKLFPEEGSKKWAYLLGLRSCCFWKRGTFFSLRYKGRK